MKQILCALLVIVIAVSCKKADEPRTGQDILRSGKWRQSGGIVKVKGFHLDTTINYLNDAAFVPDCRKDDYLVFKDNFDGAVNSGGQKCTQDEGDETAFTWELINGGANLNIYSSPDVFFTSNVSGQVVNLTDNLLAIRYVVYMESQLDNTKTDTFTFSNSYTKN